MESRDPYLIALASLWLTVPATALHFWLAWSELPARMAVHFDDRWRPNGWSTKEGSVTLAFMMLGMVLVPLTPSCYFVRRYKPSHSWPVLVIGGGVVCIIAWGANGIISRNLAG